MLDPRGPIAEAVPMRDRRSTLLLIVGAIGLLVGAVGLIADVAALALVAGAVALGVAVLAVTMPAANPSPGPVPAPVVSTPAVPTPVAPPAPTAPVAASPPGSTLTDAETGLFNEDFFNVAVDTRVSAARRHLRPVAIVLFEVADVSESGSTSPAGAEPVAAAIRETLREADTACRLRDGRFAFVLEDTPEDGAIWTVERLRRRLSEGSGTQIRWAGVACYPAHAFSAGEALTKAEGAFRAAKEWAQDRIEVAAAE